MTPNYITDDVRALIGSRSDWVEACHPVEEGEVRRFFQATMDPHPRYWSQSWAASSRYGQPVAPPAFAVHAFRRPPDDLRDPLDAMADPDFDGLSRQARAGLPDLPIPLNRLLNGGCEYEFYSYAGIGERVMRRSTIRDIYQREGKAGPMVFVVFEDEYATTGGRPLFKATNIQIRR